MPVVLASIGDVSSGRPKAGIAGSSPRHARPEPSSREHLRFVEATDRRFERPLAVAGLIEKFGVGVVAEDTSPEGWAEAIKGLLQRRAEMHRNALSAAAELTWESCEEKLRAVVGEARRVTLLSIRDLTSYNRERRMACSLAEHGVAVTVCTPADPSSAPAWHPRVRFSLLDLS